MGYTNSSYVSKIQLTNKCNPRVCPISKITIHHAAGCSPMEVILNYLATTSNEVSANYVLGGGKVGLNVEEKNRAWTSSSSWNDQRAVTIEVANSSAGGNWPISDVDLAMLIKLCADICKRNGIPKLYYDGTKNGSLTIHSMFAQTSCPGPYIKSKLDYICTEVNKLISGKPASTPNPAPVSKNRYKVVKSLYGYTTASDAEHDKNRKVTVQAGTYYVYNETSAAVNVTLKAGIPGAWINKSKNVNTTTNLKYDWKKGQCVHLKRKRTALFANDTSTTPAGYLKPGTYYIYDGVLCKQGRFRITSKSEYCGKSPAGNYVTGYVSVDNFT